MVRAAFGSLMALLVVACAGRSISRDEGAGGSSGDDTGGSAGTTGGFGGTGTTGGTGGTATTGGSGATVATGGTVAQGGTTATGGRPSGGRGGTVGRGGGSTAGTAGVIDPICALPPDPGPCDAAIRSYAYDVETGLCLPFIYGGCGGNGNVFATAEDCYRACDRAGVGGTAYCENSSECTRIPARCCCTAASFETVVGVNHEHQLVIEGTKCATIDCVTCFADPALAWFGSTCSENHCVAWDAREEDLTLCSTSADCTLRYGLGCCQNCPFSGDTLVAVNLAIAGPWICPDGQPPCPACLAPPSPTPQSPRVGVYADCVNGRCAVAYPL